MSTLKEQIEALKEQRISEIINDTSITKLRKLELFSEEGLFGIEDFIRDKNIFKEWVEELQSMVKSENGGNHALIDTFLSPASIDLDRHRTFHLYEVADILFGLMEDTDEEYEDEVLDYPNPLPVVTARRSKLTINKTPAEVIDKVYEYAITNKVCGYTIDW